MHTVADAAEAVRLWVTCPITKTGIFESLDWHVQQHAQTAVPIIKEELIQHRSWVYWWDKYWGEFVKDIEHLEIFYEDLVSNPDVITKAHSYLGLPPHWTAFVLPIIGERKLKHPQTQELIDILKEEENDSDCEWPVVR